MDWKKAGYWLVLGLMAATTAYTYTIRHHKVITATGADFSRIPATLGDWAGTDFTFGTDVLDVLKADKTFFRRYANSGGEEVWLFIGYWANQKYGAQPHSPLHCLPGSGWNIVANELVPLAAGTGSNGGAHVDNVNFAVIANGFLRGTRGPNRYGPYPLHRKEPDVDWGRESADENIALLTSFRGRISRKSWWIGTVFLINLSVVGVIFWSRGPIWVHTIWQLLLVFPTTAITVKRFNDRDWPNWLGYGVGLTAALLTIGQHFGFFTFGPDMSTTEGIVGLVLYLPLLFALIDNGFLRGTKGPNRYGPDPLSSTGEGAQREG